MFLISLAIFTLILTVFENIFVAFLVLILVVWVTLSVPLIKGEEGGLKKHKHKILFIILAFALSLLSIFFKNYSYTQKIDSISMSTWLISQNMDWPQWSYFVWTWIISDIYSYQRFIFEDNSGREYFLNSEKDYKIWDVIRLNWYVSLGYTWSKNIFNLWQQLNSFTQKPNLSWLFSYEFDYPKRLMMKGFYGTIYEQNSVNISKKCDSVILSETKNPAYVYSGSLANAQDDITCKQNLSFLQKIRKNLQKNIISAYWENPQAGLILWMLVGDKSQIPPDEYDWFIDSWLVHIIAVSGWNIIMIVVFLWAVLFFLPFYVRNAVILCTIILYAMICGMDSSVFRATIMWWLWMLALFRWREVNIRRAMSIAFIVMLIVNPYFLAYDVGFLLSFSAIIGIVYFGKAIESISTENKPSVYIRTDTSLIRETWTVSVDQIREASQIREEEQSEGGFINKIFKSKIIQKISKEYITPTIWATLWVLPIMLFFMGKTNLTWILANFLVVPIVAIVMIYWFVSTIIYKILPRDFILRPEKILTKYIYLVSDRAWDRGMYLQAEWAWIKYALLILFVVWFISERFRK
jgi:ComEC/Rec2-related protein